MWEKENAVSAGRFLPGGRDALPEQESRLRRQRWILFRGVVWLMLGDGLLLCMILSGKIDLMYGVLFVAGLSEECGYSMKEKSH